MILLGQNTNKLSGNVIIENRIKIDFINARPYELAPFIKKIESCCLWLQHDIGFKLNGRIPIYKENIEQFYRLRGQFNDKLYYSLQSFYELNQIVRLHEHLKHHNSKRFIQNVKTAVKGIVFRDQPDRADNDKARNHLFELLTSCDYSYSGQKIDLTRRADIILTEAKLIIECKRVNSVPAVLERLNEGVAQIVGDESGFDGVVYIDMTEVFDDAHTIFILNETGPVGSILEISDDDQTRNFFQKEIEHRTNDLIRENIINRLKPMPKKLLGIVLVYNFVGFHVNMIYERVIVGQVKKFIRNPLSQVSPAIVVESL